MWHSEQLLIDGQLVEAEGGRTYETRNPATGAVLGTAADATAGDTNRAIAAARRAFDTTDWATNKEFRARCLRQLHEKLIEHQEELRALIVADVGAPVSLTTGPQLEAPIEMVPFYADLAESYQYSTDLGVAEAMGQKSKRWVEKEAIGVVAAIIPYNYPIQITIAKVAPALAAGCTVVVKSPPQTPWVSATLGAILAETDIPAGVVNVLTSSDGAVGEQLVTDPRVDMVSFTGSTATGRRIMAAASDTVKKVFLELGGKSAFVMLDDADVTVVSMFASFMICSHAGQGCAIASRLLVPESKYAEVVEAVKTMIESVAVGDPTDPANYMGPLVSADQLAKVDGMVQEALKAGAKAVTGGNKIEGSGGYFFEPTVLADVDNKMAIAQDEVFGPVLCVIPYRNDDHAIEIANDSIFGLSGVVIGADDDRATAVARRIRSGTISINGGLYYGADAPFGGYKQSGIGREMGVAGMEEYLESKTLALPAS
ncbi:MAG: aldehyde dehydrogenase [Actinomycetota bacterium]